MACDRDGLAAGRIDAAEMDLAAAEKLASGEPLFAAAVYHCTLSAEKALKAYLLHLDVEAPVTHDLTVLVEAVAEREPAARRLRPAAELLTPYGVAYRSIEPMEPDREGFERALDRAYEVHDFVTDRMP